MARDKGLVINEALLRLHQAQDDVQSAANLLDGILEPRIVSELRVVLDELSSISQEVDES